MQYRLLVLAGLLFISFSAQAQNGISRNTYRTVMKMPDSVSVNNGNLMLYNVFKAQVKVLYESRNRPDHVRRKALIEATYLPYRRFWESYVGDSSVYADKLMRRLIKDSMHLFEQKAPLFARGGIDRYFAARARQIDSATGLTPRGSWHLAFGHAATDMGGFGDGTMVLDLSHPKTSLSYTEFILPHEMSHQVFDFSNRIDTTARGLYRCINEGLAVYVHQKLTGSSHNSAYYLQYSEAELAYCIANEAAIFSKLKRFLLTTDADHAMALADRGQIIFKDGGPGAIGYFIGYRICEAYVRNNGPDSWKDIFTMPVREVLEKSGYDGK